MAKNVQISETLFLNLVKYFLLNDNSNIEIIKRELQNKLDSLSKRELYSKSKDNNLSAEEREVARKKYLDLIGMSDNFRY